MCSYPIVSGGSFTAFDSHAVSAPSPTMKPKSWEEGSDTSVPFKDEHSVTSYSLHLVLFLSLLNHCLLQIEASLMRVRNALIYGCNDKP